jgi:hypothetical protein
MEGKIPRGRHRAGKTQKGETGRVTKCEKNSRKRQQETPK